MLKVTKPKGILSKQALHQFPRTYSAYSSLAGPTRTKCFGHAAHGSISFFACDKNKVSFKAWIHLTGVSESISFQQTLMAPEGLVCFFCRIKVVISAVALCLLDRCCSRAQPVLLLLLSIPERFPGIFQHILSVSIIRPPAFTRRATRSRVLSARVSVVGYIYRDRGRARGIRSRSYSL